MNRRMNGLERRQLPSPDPRAPFPDLRVSVGPPRVPHHTERRQAGAHAPRACPWPSHHAHSTSGASAPWAFLSPGPAAKGQIWTQCFAGGVCGKVIGVGGCWWPGDGHACSQPPGVFSPCDGASLVTAAQPARLWVVRGGGTETHRADVGVAKRK